MKSWLLNSYYEGKIVESHIGDNITVLLAIAKTNKTVGMVNTLKYITLH